MYRSVDAQPRAVAEAIGRQGVAARRVRCVMGHMLFGLHRYVDEPVSYITMLRHPFRRLLSHYAYVRRTLEHYLHAEVVARRLTFDEYMLGGLSSELNDGQVRLLCGREDAQDVAYGQVPEAMLEEAQTNLRDFVAVGVSERFDESLALFQALLGWTSRRVRGAEHRGVDDGGAGSHRGHAGPHRAVQPARSPAIRLRVAAARRFAGGPSDRAAARVFRMRSAGRSDEGAG